MSNYYYKDDAKHYDHHKEFTINLKSADEGKAILRELMKDDEEEADYEEVEEEQNENFDSKLKNVTDLMWRENVLSHKYDYAFIKMYMDSTKGGFPMFKTTPDFLQYLSRINCLKVPRQSTFNLYYDIDKIVDGRIHLKYDKAEDDRANMIISKFVELMK